MMGEFSSTLENQTKKFPGVKKALYLACEIQKYRPMNLISSSWHPATLGPLVFQICPDSRTSLA